MKAAATVLIPTFNNPEYLNPCVISIANTGSLNGLIKLIIVNNGKQPIKEQFGMVPNVQVLEPGENLGWERGLAYGLKHVDTEYVCFQNDDVFIPKANQQFYSHLLYPFANQNIAAVGPATTVASGWHSIFLSQPLRQITEVSFLIFFTVMLRMRDLIAAGGIDTSCPGGDDLDLSIRLRKLGRNLVINPDAFLIHHGFKTGERVRGAPSVAGGWNSKEMSDATNRWLIQKHGFKTYLETMRGFDYAPSVLPTDQEGEVVAQFVRGPQVVELGCGYRKTVPNAIGIDWTPPGDRSAFLENVPCVADIQADVSKPLPLEPLSVDAMIARHILEHIVDSVDTLKNWNRVLKIGGRMIIAVPNQEYTNTIPMNPEHVHAFSPPSLKHLMETVGFKEIEARSSGNGISFVSCFEKVTHADALQKEPVLELVHA